jgi:hypothetical protein
VDMNTPPLTPRTERPREEPTPQKRTTSESLIGTNNDTRPRIVQELNKKWVDSVPYNDFLETFVPRGKANIKCQEGQH